MNTEMLMKIQRHYFGANYVAPSSFLDIRIKDKFVSSHCGAAIAYTDTINFKKCESNDLNSASMFIQTSVHKTSIYGMISVKSHDSNH